MIRTTTPTRTLAPPRTLLVNAAFLQEIKDSNPDLWHAMHQLRQLCESEEPTTSLLRRLVRSLDDLRDRWALQFALEESYGYISVSSPNDLSNAEMTLYRSTFEQAELACSQHCGLYLQLSDLAEQAEELQFRGVTFDQFQHLLSQTRQFDVAIRQHERFEQALIEGSV